MLKLSHLEHNLKRNHSTFHCGRFVVPLLVLCLGNLFCFVGAGVVLSRFIWSV